MTEIEYEYEKRWEILEQLLTIESQQSFRNALFNRGVGIRDVQLLMVAIANGEYRQKQNHKYREEEAKQRVNPNDK